ncbi:hypothetical protein D1AOALGA4SA_12683 [Olavius algarvensis Delta 1 endosymbiont]|nr:hypothetical protein D1AOALGA4SA_12683 [Olavius algarvensis Delta 1 endosymbiont]
MDLRSAGGSIYLKMIEQSDTRNPQSKIQNLKLSFQTINE